MSCCCCTLVNRILNFGFKVNIAGEKGCLFCTLFYLRFLRGQRRRLNQLRAHGYSWLDSCKAVCSAQSSYFRLEECIPLRTAIRGWHIPPQMADNSKKGSANIRLLSGKLNQWNLRKYWVPGCFTGYLKTMRKSRFSLCLSVSPAVK